ncbi:hypothetical protein M0R45_016157 [Rubus argutus]|uniref:Uncharacterized protein n=1 Tax=Rubus argutus TaxID=59490 RepID=A0AAW1XRN7_RUBAR
MPSTPPPPTYLLNCNLPVLMPTAQSPCSNRRRHLCPNPLGFSCRRRPISLLSPETHGLLCSTSLVVVEPSQHSSSSHELVWTRSSFTARADTVNSIVIPLLEFAKPNLDCKSEHPPVLTVHSSSQTSPSFKAAKPNPLVVAARSPNP